MLILGIDPGLTTGICALKLTKTPKGFVVVTALEIPWDSRFEVLKALIDGSYFNTKVPQPPEALVVERFKLRQARALQQTGSDFPSSQVIGAVGAFLFLDNRLECLHFQDPIMMSRVAIEKEDEEMLTGSEHKKDAYKHARLFYLLNFR